MFLKPIRDLTYPDFGNGVPCLHAFALHLIRYWIPPDQINDLPFLVRYAVAPYRQKMTSIPFCHVNIKSHIFLSIFSVFCLFVWVKSSSLNS